MSKYCRHRGSRDTDHQVATVVMAAAQLVPSQFKNFLTWSA